MEKKKRILVLIDGFNYYHKLKEYQDKYNKVKKLMSELDRDALIELLWICVYNRENFLAQGGEVW